MCTGDVGVVLITRRKASKPHKSREEWTNKDAPRFQVHLQVTVSFAAVQKEISKSQTFWLTLAMQLQFVRDKLLL